MKLTGSRVEPMVPLSAAAFMPATLFFIAVTELAGQGTRSYVNVANPDETRRPGKCDCNRSRY
jgi:hypothetical protein